MHGFCQCGLVQWFKLPLYVPVKSCAERLIPPKSPVQAPTNCRNRVRISGGIHQRQYAIFRASESAKNSQNVKEGFFSHPAFTEKGIRVSPALQRTDEVCPRQLNIIHRLLYEHYARLQVRKRCPFNKVLQFTANNGGGRKNLFPPHQLPAQDTMRKVGEKRGRDCGEHMLVCSFGLEYAQHCCRFPVERQCPQPAGAHDCSVAFAVVPVGGFFAGKCNSRILAVVINGAHAGVAGCPIIMFASPEEHIFVKEGTAGSIVKSCIEPR